MPCIRKEWKIIIMKQNTTQKAKYKVTNWKEYNQCLCNRGNFTIWIPTNIETMWQYTGTNKPGGKLLYSNIAMELCLTLRALYGLGYRQTQGFVKSVFSLSGKKIKVPSYTQMQRRSKTIEIDIRIREKLSSPLDIVLDSTGLKVYGEGEWKVRTHGKDKNRTWRKVHIATDTKDLTILSVAVTGNNIDDASAGKNLIEEIKEPIKSCAGDGAYDKKKFRSFLDKNVRQLIPPPRNAVISKTKDPAFTQRDKAIIRIKKIGRKEWKKEIRYHKRSLSEVNMYRYKKTFTGELKARKPKFEVCEVKIKCKILNKFIEIGMPKSIKMAA